MAEDHRPGAVYWIDHYVSGTNDIERSERFYESVLGTEARRANGAALTAKERENPHILFLWVTNSFHFGTCLQPQPLPAPRELGREYPRYGYFIREAEIDDHLRRLDRNQVPHTDPIRTSEEGESGTAIYWQDPDGNQLEFWAPEHLPAGAMEGEGPLHMGRCSSVVLGCRDLARSVDFYSRWWGVDPIYSAEIPQDTAALVLAGGGRVVLKQVDVLGQRTRGHTQWEVLHTALAVREDEFMPLYHRLWEALPEWDYDPTITRGSTEGEESLPARMGVHSDFDLPWKQAFGRGQTLYDWDTNACHFYPALPVDGSMVVYEAGDIRSYYQNGGQKPQPEATP